MSLRRLGRKLKGLCLPLAVLLGVQSVLYGQECCGGGAGHCQKFHCPPCFKHCQVGPPRIKFKCACPLPVCVPCDAPNWGYYQPCWRPWPWPPNWSHCPYPVPAAHIAPCPQQLPVGAMSTPGGTGEQPRQLQQLPGAGGVRPGM